MKETLLTRKDLDLTNPLVKGIFINSDSAIAINGNAPVSKTAHVYVDNGSLEF